MIVAALLSIQRVWLTIRQAAARHGAPRQSIENALRRGALPSTGTGHDRRVLASDVDLLAPYEPRPKAVEAAFYNFRFSAEEVRILSYSLTVAVALDRLIGAEPDVVRGLQMRFGDPSTWTVGWDLPEAQ